MTPKEKAIELYYNFSKCKDESNRYFVIPIIGDAKILVLIAIDEITKLIKESSLEGGNTLEWWSKVKDELKKL
jgi:hypothetical protein